MNTPNILLISKDAGTQRLLETAASSPITIHRVSTAAEGVRLWKETTPLLVVCESSFHTLAPLLKHVRQTTPFCPVLAISTHHSVKDAVETMRAGASDYLPQPVSLEEMRAALARLIQLPSSITSASPLQDTFEQIISISPQMNLVKQLAREVAETDATVLITGESGTGKELFAQAIHATSPRAQGPMVALNCASIPEHLIEAELFGYRQGAFTDAKHAKLGRFQIAEGGTLFLDEIGEMSATAQAKLLRVLENRTIDPLGATQSCKVNIRVIAATNEDLLAHIKSGRFRLDLYYRLNVYQLRIPPLRERPEDIEPILMVFLERARQEHGCRVRIIDSDALAILQRHDWPGNVRELHNVVEWLTITCKQPVIQPEHLPHSVHTLPPSPPPSSDRPPSLLTFGLSFQEMERKLLEEALQKTSGNVSEASRLLKITRNTLRYRMAKYHIQ